MLLQSIQALIMKFVLVANAFLCPCNSGGEGFRKNHTRIGDVIDVMTQ